MQYFKQANLNRKRICEESDDDDGGDVTTTWADDDDGFYHRYTHRTREETPPSESEVPWIFSFGGTTGAESQRRWLMKWVWCS